MPPLDASVGAVVRVYTPESPVRHPGRLARHALDDIAAARPLAWRLAVRDISALYRQALLGYVWAVLPVAMLTLVWVALNRSAVVEISTGTIPYAVFALTGTVFWQLFLDALNAPLSQLTANKSVLVRVRFPPEALLLSGIIQVTFSFVLKLVLLAVVIVAYDVHVAWTAPFVLAPAAAIVCLGTVVGVAFAPLGVLYRDVQQVLLAIVTPLLFLTPVFYPRPASGAAATLMRYNPLTPLFEMTRGLLFGVGPRPWMAFLLVFFGAIGIAIAAWIVLRIAMPLLIERMEA